MIEIQNLKKTFGSLKVLEDINITIQDGEVYGLVGKSGAGKSTLLRCINGLVAYDEGNLQVNGTEVNQLNKKEQRCFRKDIGMIFQHFSLMERRTVYENIALPLRCWHYDKKQMDHRVRELVELVGIAEKIHEKPRVLSGGQKQRVAIARALAMEPAILLCDEATSALDPNTTGSILKLLTDIHRQLNLTIVVVTHQMSVVKDLCDRISILEHGRLAATGKVEDIFMNQPPELKRLLGKEEIVLPDQGVNIRFLLSAAQAKEPILSDLAKQFDLDIVLTGARMEKYKEKMLGSLIINVDATKFHSVTNYLDQRHYTWELISSGDGFPDGLSDSLEVFEGEEHLAVAR